MNKWYYGVGWNALVVDTLLNKAPSAAWFASADTMATGYLYDAPEVNGLLAEARGAGRCRFSGGSLPRSWRCAGSRKTGCREPSRNTAMRG